MEAVKKRNYNVSTQSFKDKRNPKQEMGAYGMGQPLQNQSPLKNKQATVPPGKYELHSSTPRNYSGWPKNMGPEIKENEVIARNAWQSAMAQLREAEGKLYEADSNKKVIVHLQEELMDTKRTINQHLEARKEAEAQK